MARALEGADAEDFFKSFEASEAPRPAAAAAAVPRAWTTSSTGAWAARPRRGRPAARRGRGRARRWRTSSTGEVRTRARRRRGGVRAGGRRSYLAPTSGAREARVPPGTAPLLAARRVCTERRREGQVLVLFCVPWERRPFECGTSLHRLTLPSILPREPRGAFAALPSAGGAPQPQASR